MRYDSIWYKVRIYFYKNNIVVLRGSVSASVDSIVERVNVLIEVC